MNKEQIKGKWHEQKGKVKKKIGRMTGSTETESKGLAEEVMGKIEKGVGRVKRALQKGIDAI